MESQNREMEAEIVRWKRHPGEMEAEFLRWKRHPGEMEAEFLRWKRHRGELEGHPGEMEGVVPDEIGKPK